MITPYIIIGGIAITISFVCAWYDINHGYWNKKYEV